MFRDSSDIDGLIVASGFGADETIVNIINPTINYKEKKNIGNKFDKFIYHF